MLQKKKKKKDCWLNSFIYSKYNTYIMKCNKINDHAFCYVLHWFCWLKCWNWQMLNRHMRLFSVWHSLIKVWRYMVKSTTIIECACWKVDNTGFVSHLTEEAWLTVSNLFCDSSSFGRFSNFHSHHLIIPLWFSNFKNNTLFLIFKQCHMTSLKFEIQIFQYFWGQTISLSQHYVASGLQNIKMSHLLTGTDKENITWSNKISGNWNICFWLDHDTKHLENCLYS